MFQSSRCYNKCDALTPDERRRQRDLDPSALTISALTKEGLAELVDTIASRLELDVRRVTLTFDPDDPEGPGAHRTPVSSRPGADP